jgi:hypothetical protein
LWKILACVAILFAVVRVFAWWQETGVEALASRHGAAIVPPAGPQARANQFSAGRDARPRPQDAQPEVQGGPGAASVNKCVGRTGTAYSDGPCPAGAIATAVETPSDLNVSQGLAKGHAQPERQVAPSAYVPVQRDAGVAKADVKAECEALTMDSHKWDVFARQPMSGHAQDEVRARQREIRARKFELRC